MYKKLKKYTDVICIVIVLILAIGLSFYFNTINKQADYEIIENCSVDGRTIILHTQTCPACIEAVPILEELEKELNMEFEFYDLTTSEDTKKVMEIGINFSKVPTIISDCKKIVGVRTKEEYRRFIKG